MDRAGGVSKNKNKRILLKVETRRSSRRSAAPGESGLAKAIEDYDAALKNYIPHKIKTDEANDKPRRKRLRKEPERSVSDRLVDVKSAKFGLREIKSDKSNTPSTSAGPCESMEWEYVLEEINQVRTASSDKNISVDVFPQKNWNSVRAPDVNVYVIVDTNIFLSHLKTVEMMIIDSLVDFNECFQPMVVVPWRVLCELDRFKNNTKLQLLARQALSFVRVNIKTNKRLAGQSLKDANDYLYPCDSPDDEILNCCLQILNKGKAVILLSNDKNLSSKAIVNNVKAYTNEEFLKELAAKKTTKNSESTSLQSVTQIPDDFSEHYEKIQKELKEFLSPILRAEMEKHYNELWTKVVLVEPPWTLNNILECITKHWIAVFSEILAKDTQQTLRSLKFYFPKRRKFTPDSLHTIKDIIALSTKFVKCFEKTIYKEKSLKCSNIIKNILTSQQPSKQTVQSPIKNVVNVTPTQNINSRKESVNTIISNTFIHIWNGFVAYCTQLADYLGVSHTLVVNVQNNTSHDDLIQQADSVAQQLRLLIENFSKVLVCYPIEDTSPEYKRIAASQASDALYCILHSTVLGMGQNNLSFTKLELMQYCSIHSDVLEDGFNKFTMLQKLLIECSNQYSKCQMDL